MNDSQLTLWSNLLAKILVKTDFKLRNTDYLPRKCVVKIN
ncbi:hypothetical protein FQV37_2679 [Psychrobacter nivimaris]|uniref:Uncharacterized protein n=1 Tax=Psychrobacter nivimaris TaxID=281738 RepID=A0A6N7C2T5_9GAMM|nr:hypothetical protein FQV37_2679 [Psychrobacter nivimaris]